MGVPGPRLTRADRYPRHTGPGLSDLSAGRGGRPTIPNGKQEQMTNDGPVFVVGSARSGTTMLRLMLNQHSRLAVPPESWFLTDLMDRFPFDRPLTGPEIEAAISFLVGHWRWQEWGVTEEGLRARLGAGQSLDLARLVEAVFRLVCGETVRWGDKTPGYLVEIERLSVLFPTAQFIHIIRDARDVAVSLAKTGWKGDTIWGIGRYWNEDVGWGCREGRRLSSTRYLEVGYSTLVLEPEATLRGLCEFLGESFEPPMLTFYERSDQFVPEREWGFHSKTMRAPRADDLDRWRNELPTRSVVLLEAAAGRTMRTVGQRLRYPAAAAALRPIMMGMMWLAERSLPWRRKLGLHFPTLRKEL